MTAELQPIKLVVPVLRGSGRARGLLGRLDDGRTALFAYTSKDKMIECCGDGRTAISADMERVGSLVQTSGGCDVVMLDAPLSDELRQALTDDAEPDSYTPTSWLSSPSDAGRR